MAQSRKSTEVEQQEPLQAKGDYMQQIEELSDEDLKYVPATDIITLISDIPQSDAHLKQRLLNILEKLYALHLRDSQKVVDKETQSIWQKIATLFATKKVEVVPKWETTLCGTRVNFRISRVNEHTLRCEPTSGNGGWASMNIPLRSDIDIDYCQYILENLSEEARAKLAAEITYTKEQASKGGMEIYVQQAIAKACFQNA